MDPLAAQLHIITTTSCSVAQLLLLWQLLRLVLVPEAEQLIAEDLDQFAQNGGAAELEEVQQAGRDYTHLCVPGQ